MTKGVEFTHLVYFKQEAVMTLPEVSDAGLQLLGYEKRFPLSIGVKYQRTT